MKKVKDPNAPTKPPTPYILFLWGDKTNPELLGAGKVNALKSDDPQIVHKDAVAQAAAAWKDMSDEDKAPYVERNAALKTLYTSAMETYNSDSDNNTTEPTNDEPSTETTLTEPTPSQPTTDETVVKKNKSKNAKSKKTKPSKN